MPHFFRPEGAMKSMTPAPAEEHLTVTVAVAEKQMLFGGYDTSMCSSLILI